MRFLNPAGLFLLLGIPLLIIIYLIKSQHEQRSVSSTYIWKLSERFAKKRLPLLRLRRILLFILQLTMIVLAAMMAAKPVIVQGESYDYVVILDGSASMQSVDEKGVSRFENAVKAIEKQAKDLSEGHTMSIVLAKDAATLLIDGGSTLSDVRLALGKASCANGGCAVSEALAIAQEICDRSKNAKVLFYTDSDYEQAGNVTVINMSRQEWNVSLTALDVQEQSEKTVFQGSLVSYHQDAKVTVGLAIDGKTVDAKTVKCLSDQPTDVIFEREGLKAFDKAEIFIESKDALACDDRYALCQKNSKRYDVLLVSEAPFYLESALKSLGNCNLTVCSSLEGIALSGMDLYIFDGIVPKEYPSDGSVILFGTENLPDGLGCSLFYEEQCRISVNSDLKSDIYNGLTLRDAVVKGYRGLLGNRDWSYLFYCEGVPVSAFSVQENGACFVVFSFDLHDSNLPLLAEYPVLMNNLLENCIVRMISKTDYTVGEAISVFPLPATTEIYLQYPDESVKTVYLSGQQGQLRADQVGVYTLVMKGESGGEYADFFVHIPEGETEPRVEGAINVALEQQSPSEKEEALSAIWVWFAAAFLLTLLLEWGWYYYEQY